MGEIPGVPFDNGNITTTPQQIDIALKALGTRHVPVFSGSRTVLSPLFKAIIDWENTIGVANRVQKLDVVVTDGDIQRRTYDYNKEFESKDDFENVQRVMASRSGTHRSVILRIVPLQDRWGAKSDEDYPQGMKHYDVRALDLRSSIQQMLSEFFAENNTMV